MTYRETPPPALLRPYVRCFLSLQHEDTLAQPTPFGVLADGCPGLIFQNNPAALVGPNNAPFPQLFLHGLTTTSSHKTATASYQTTVVCLQPQALKSLFGIDAHLLTNRFVDLNDCVKNELGGKLLASSPEERVALLIKFLMGQLARNQPDKHRTVDFVIETIRNRTGLVSLKTIQEDLRLSERLLERLMQTHVGVSPKQFARICRFQAALSHLCERPFARLTDLAYDYGYADQSHYIRDFRAFAGVTPGRFLRRAANSLQNFPEWS